MSPSKDGCACGQVIFNLSGRKAGETLICPWCQKTYRYSDQGTLEPLTDKPNNRSSQRLAADYAAESIATKKEEVRSSQRRTGRQLAPVVFPAKKSESVKLTGGLGESRRATKRHDFRDIPGGLPRMLIFLVAFNLLAFTALYFFQKSSWGETIPKGAVWPLLVTLVAGHFVGFIAWSFSVYRLQMKKFMALQEEKKKKGSC